MTKNFRSLIGCISLTVLAATSYAETIKYVDDKGTLSFVDDLGKVPKKYRKNVIQEKEQDAVQVISGDSGSRQEGAVGDGMVQICLHRTIEKDDRLDPHDLTDFLAARDYNYRTRDVSRNPENLAQCSNMYCKSYVKQMNDKGLKDYNMKNCTESIARVFASGEALPMTFIGEKFYQGTSMDLSSIIDKYFGVNPRTPVKWLD